MFLLECIESVSGVVKSINRIRKRYANKAKIYLLHANNLDSSAIENHNVNFISSFREIGKRPVDVTFHFANKNTFFPLLAHVIRAVKYRLFGISKKQYIVNLNLRFWEISPFISHIRFALLVNMAIFSLLYYLMLFLIHKKYNNQ